MEDIELQRLEMLARRQHLRGGRFERFDKRADTLLLIEAPRARALPQHLDLLAELALQHGHHLRLSLELSPAAADGFLVDQVPGCREDLLLPLRDVQLVPAAAFAVAGLLRLPVAAIERPNVHEVEG